MGYLPPLLVAGERNLGTLAAFLAILSDYLGNQPFKRRTAESAELFSNVSLASLTALLLLALLWVCGLVDQQRCMGVVGEGSCWLLTATLRCEAWAVARHRACRCHVGCCEQAVALSDCVCTV